MDIYLGFGRETMTRMSVKESTLDHSSLSESNKARLAYLL